MNQKSVAAIGCINRIYVDTTGDGNKILMLEVKRFEQSSLSFTYPFDSSSIGSFHCQGGLESEILKVKFTDIVYKCFLFPMKLPAIATVVPENPDQSWICQVIKHADLY